MEKKYRDQNPIELFSFFVEAVLATFSSILNTKGQSVLTEKIIKPVLKKFPAPFNVVETHKSQTYKDFNVIQMFNNKLKDLKDTDNAYNFFYDYQSGKWRKWDPKINLFDKFHNSGKFIPHKH